MITQAEMLADAKEVLGDMGALAQTFTNEGGTVSWQAAIGEPVISQELTSGGFKEMVSHQILLVASPASWTTAYGTVSAAALSSGQPVADLAIGKTLVASDQGNRKYRIKNVAFRARSGWVTLLVTNEDDF